MIQLIEQAAAVQQFLEERGWRSCVIGGIAVLRWGEPRLTRDVDIALFTGFGREQSFIEPILQRFAGRIVDAQQFGLANRVLLLRGDTGVPIDIALAALPFEEEMINRASDFEFVPGISLRTASAEDLVVLKAFANRDRDWVDVAAIVARQFATLDWAAIRERLAALAPLKPDHDIVARLDALSGTT